MARELRRLIADPFPRRHFGDEFVEPDLNLGVIIEAVGIDGETVACSGFA